MDITSQNKSVTGCIDCSVRWLSSLVVAGSREGSLVSAKLGATDISGSLTNSALI